MTSVNPKIISETYEEHDKLIMAFSKMFERYNVDSRFYLIIELYRKMGIKYGVRWDFALIQAILETGWFSFSKDVKEHQYNYVGIGAVGNGAPGESFKNPQDGVEAAVQLLAIRAGKHVPFVISSRYKELYGKTFNKIKYYSELGNGIHAADPNYWSKLFKIAHTIEIYEKVDILKPRTGLEKIDKILINAKDDGVGCAIALTKGTYVTKCYFNNIDGLYDFLSQLPDTEIEVEIQNIKKDNIPEDCPTWPAIDKTEQTEPEVEPRPPMQTQLLLDIPFAKKYRYGDFNFVRTGKYPGEYPKGAVVHHTAGFKDAKSCLDFLIKKNYPCLVIDRDGVVWQSFPLNLWGWHDGTKYSRTCVGIEVIGDGKLEYKSDGWYSWYGQKVPDSEVRVIERTGVPEQIPIAGAYQKFTPAQEKSIIELLAWLKRNAPNKFDTSMILGHDETSKLSGKYGRKNDPGGSLSMNMDELRRAVVERVRILDGDVAEPVPQNLQPWSGIREFRKNTNMQLTKNFYLQEFACHCDKCDTIKIDYLQLSRLQALRDHFGAPLIIHSGYRCESHNRKVGGAPKSQHVTGRATDFHIKGIGLNTIKSKVWELWEHGGIGQYSTFYHTDTWNQRRW